MRVASGPRRASAPRRRGARAAVRGVAKWPRCCSCCRASAARCPRRACPSSARLRRGQCRRRPATAARAAPTACRPLPWRPSRPRSRSCRRSSPCARRPRESTTAPSTRRSAPTSRAALPRGGAEGARPLRLAPRRPARGRHASPTSPSPGCPPPPGAGARGRLLAAVGVAVEAFAWMNRHGEHPAARALARPGTSCSACWARAAGTGPARGRRAP